jgi:hypothetical protein
VLVFSLEGVVEKQALGGREEIVLKTVLVK